jgi:hypothetical protein
MDDFLTTTSEDHSRVLVTGAMDALGLRVVEALHQFACYFPAPLFGSTSLRSASKTKTGFNRSLIFLPDGKKLLRKCVREEICKFADY